MSPRRERPPVTLVVDGVEVEASEGTMLVDAAKRGDIEIPVFCYEPKLGPPVGACRMCLVEIEGVPKLQTACSTPARDGMVVYTQTDRVKEAQEAVVEFLLVNHPLDCPVCDKGGECPLQDIALGWGPGRSRFTDPKRHFQKPIPLSPLVRIDRERCILCYRCVRFSQEVAEDEQLQLLERGAATYVGTFDDRPYIAPFHGNIIELCPVGALTSEAYRFRARPWEIEDAGTICTLCPSQCNIRLTVRDERVTRVLARDNPAVDDGWLCDKGRFGFQFVESEERISEPMVRESGAVRAATWAEAIEAAARGLRESGAGTGALIGGQTSNEEGYLVQWIMREALGSPHLDSGRRGKLDRDTLARLSSPGLGAAISDIDRAEAILVLGVDPLHEAPILDLRIRKAVRRAGVSLTVASARPTALDGGAEEVVRYAPGEGGAFVRALAEAATSDAREATGPYGEGAREVLASLGRESAVVIVWGSRLLAEGGGAALADLAEALRLTAIEGSGLIEIPEETNGRGLREVGCIPTAGPGLSEANRGLGASEIRAALEGGELAGVLLVNSDPVRDHLDGPGWERALQKAKFVLSISAFENASTKHADVIFPAEAYAEKDGTMTHPDGRLQRLRPGVPHPGDVRPGWQVILELSAALGHELDLHTAPEILAAIASEVPFYAGVTHEEIGGTGVRWQEREVATAAGRASGMRSPEDIPGEERPGDHRPPGPGEASETSVEPTPDDRPDGGIRLGTYRDLWTGEMTERNPALRFLAPKQTLELAPADGERLGVEDGDEVSVSSNGTSVKARVALRERIRPGAGFLIEGTSEDNANALAGAEVVEVRREGPADDPVVPGGEAEEATGT